MKLLESEAKRPPPHLCFFCSNYKVETFDSVIEYILDTHRLLVERSSDPEMFCLYQALGL